MLKVTATQVTSFVDPALEYILEVRKTNLQCNILDLL